MGHFSQHASSKAFSGRNGNDDGNRESPRTERLKSSSYSNRIDDDDDDDMQLDDEELNGFSNKHPSKNQRFEGSLDEQRSSVKRTESASSHSSLSSTSSFSGSHSGLSVPQRVSARCRAKGQAIKYTEPEEDDFADEVDEEDANEASLEYSQKSKPRRKKLVKVSEASLSRRARPVSDDAAFSDEDESEQCGWSSQVRNDEEDSDIGDAEEVPLSNEEEFDVEPSEFLLKIEKLVAYLILTRDEWAVRVASMNTSKVTKGRRNEVLQAEEALEKAELSKITDPKEYKRVRKERKRKLRSKARGRKEETRYLVKWLRESYLHCTWETARSLKLYLQDTKLVDRQIKKLMSSFKIMDEEEFSDMQRIDRTIDSNSFLEEVIVNDGSKATNGPATAETSQISSVNSEVAEKPGTEISEDPNQNEVKEVVQWEYLVKWKSQGYEDATWELYEDIKSLEGCDEAIARMKKRDSDAYRLSRSSLGVFDPTYRSDRTFKRGRKLRSYQVEAVDWLTFNHTRGRGSILADEMGLGKTCQTVAFCHRLRHSMNVGGPFLIVAPLATLPHWQREFDSWTDFECVTYHGAAAGREIIRRKEFWWEGIRSNISKTAPKFDALVTNYETILTDVAFLKDFRWSMLVVDEAHRLKNPESRLTVCLHDMFRMDAKLLLTGTPIQNSIPELFTLLHFIAPKDFPSSAKFAEKFGKMTTAEEMEEFHARLRPFMLRRIKREVEPLPDRLDTLIEVELTTLQKRFYRAIYEKNTAYLLAGVEKGAHVSLMNVAMELRKCCCHPYLISGVESKVLSDSPLRKDATREERDEYAFSKLVEASGKLILLDKLLPKLKDEGHRVLIFSQMTRMLDILEDYLLHRRYSYERIDGNVRGVDRQFAIDRFSAAKSQSFAFLLSTRGCGQGINLTAADTVIMYDGDWNPQNDVQALARCHRIGQTKKVQVYRLITRKTYEQTMFQRASMKLGLDRAVMQGITAATQEDEQDDTSEDVNSLSSGNKASKKKKNSGKSKWEQDRETERLLRYGAYALTGDNEEDVEARQFIDANIDEILSSRAHVMDTTNEGDADNRLSKATFVDDRIDKNLDIDDPDFWTKVVGLSAAENKSSVHLERGSRRRKAAGNSDEEHYAEFFRDGRDGDSDEEESVNETDKPKDEDKYGRKLVLRKHMFYLQIVASTFGYGRWEECVKLMQQKYPGRWSPEEIEALIRGYTVFCLLRKQKKRKGGESEGSSGDSSSEVSDDEEATNSERNGSGIGIGNVKEISDFVLVNMSSQDMAKILKPVAANDRECQVYRDEIIPDLERGKMFIIPDILVSRQRVVPIARPESNGSQLENTGDGSQAKPTPGTAFGDLEVMDSESDDSDLDSVARATRIKRKRGPAYNAEVAARVSRHAAKSIRNFDKHCSIAGILVNYKDPSSFPTVSGIRPASWWTESDDLVLLRAVFKYGWDTRKSKNTFSLLRKDPDFNFTLKPPELETESADKNAESTEKGSVTNDANPAEDGGWPSNHKLGMRAKRLADWFRARNRKGKSTKAKPEKARGSTSANVSRSSTNGTSSISRNISQQATIEWIKAEKKSAYRGLLRLGMPSASPPNEYHISYQQFLSLNSIQRKTPSMLQSYLKGFVGDAMQLRINPKIRVAERIADIVPSSTSAKKLLDRINFMRDLRTKCLSMANTKDGENRVLNQLEINKEQLVGKRKTDMPEWWNAGLDLALLRASAKWGIGTIGAHESILKDESFPFKDLCEGLSEKRRITSGKEEPGEDETPAIGSQNSSVADLNLEVTGIKEEKAIISSSDTTGADDSGRPPFPSVVHVMNRLRALVETLVKYFDIEGPPKNKSDDANTYDKQDISEQANYERIGHNDASIPYSVDESKESDVVHNLIPLKDPQSVNSTDPIEVAVKSVSESSASEVVGEGCGGMTGSKRGIGEENTSSNSDSVGSKKARVGLGDFSQTSVLLS